VNIRRVLSWGLAFVWLFLLVASYSFYSQDFRNNYRNITKPAPERAVIESGEASYYELLSRAPAYEPGEYLLLISVDNLGQAEFLSYRACYQLFPIRPIYIPITFMPPTTSRFSINPDPNLVALLREKKVGVAAVFVRPEPGRSAYYRISLENSGRMTLVRLPMKSAPPLPPTPSLLWWLAGLAVAGLSGFALVAISGLSAEKHGDWKAQLALSLYTGIGITAWLMVSFGVLRVPFSVTLILGGWAVVIGLAGVRRFFLHRSPPALPVPAVPPAGAVGERERMEWPDRIGIGLAIFAACWVLMAVAMPMSAWGNWDTWAIWNLKAKACLLAGGIPFQMLGEQIYRFSHFDYPLGLPMIHAWLATWAGGLDERLLRLLSPFYLFTLFFLMAGLLKELGMVKGRWLVAGAFITIPKLVTQGHSGYADLPVACGMAAGMLMLVRAYQGAPVGWAAGLFGGLAAVHKDEGLIWGGTSILILAIWAHRGRVKWAQVFAAGIILLALVGPWKATAARLGLRPNDYKVEPVRMLNEAGDRLPQVMRGVVLETLGPGVSIAGIMGMESPGVQWWNQFRGSWFIMWYAVLIWAVLGFRRWRRERILAWLVILPVVQACAYTAVYTASVAASLPWHITTSLDRLLLQIAPAVYILAAAACFGPVDEPPAPVMGGRDRKSRKAQLR
jgi:hypothetical protein